MTPPKVTFFGLEELVVYEGYGYTPLKMNGWNMNHGGLETDNFPFFSWVICRFQPLIFQGVLEM